MLWINIVKSDYNERWLKKGGGLMILVDIFVTSLDKSYDFQLNENVRVETIIEEISEMVCQKEHMKVVGETSKLMLCDMFAYRVLEKEKTLSESGVSTGNKLMLIWYPAMYLVFQ